MTSRDVPLDFPASRSENTTLGIPLLLSVKLLLKVLKYLLARDVDSIQSLCILRHIPVVDPGVYPRGTSVISTDPLEDVDNLEGGGGEITITYTLHGYAPPVVCVWFSSLASV